MIPAELAASPLPWLAAPEARGPDGLLFARRILRRNFAGFPFWVSASPETCAAIAERARTHAAARGFSGDLALARLSPAARGVLRERDLLPGEPASFEGKRDYKRFFQGADAGEHALFGEAEHWIEVRSSPSFAFGDEGEADEEAFSRSARYGFLTSDPGHAGAGAQFEAGLHLPGLVAQRGIAPAQRALGAMGLELRPLDPRVPATASAGYWRLRTRGGLGLPAEALRARFEAKARSLLRAEADALGQWRARDPARFEDGAHRAEGLLRNARQAEYGELLLWISRIRAGRRTGLFAGLPENALETLRVRAQPAHLAAENPDAPPDGENGLRARLAGSLLPA